ncbi:GNAT family N-acetyltransferase [Mangrovactinospora gilvigrisea]|uniref:Lysine N-acyltransferase MbtK n=1 Tax=Mangrovactinospora gilvigrisea TaxID=1428644 RepID=A0A1J7BJD3_9ACTN|nr:GNAT family N-acetyltransferase [Mangrovactinospora gilvigrisea]OIV38693.1 GNAT family N-acetyltransferase [Mangrovactinospora gilvigrisea]
MSAPVLFTRDDAGLGAFALRDVDHIADTPLLHRWLTHPKSRFWMMGDAEPAQVDREFADTALDPHRRALLGLHDGRPTFLMERYAPERSELAGLAAYRHRDGDIGMHFLCAPAERPVHGFTRAVLATVLDFLFDDPAVRRIVVEPDAANRPVHALNAAAGFRVQAAVALPGKDALLSTCTRDQYRAARATLTGAPA